MTDPNDKAIMDSLEDKDTGSKNGKKETLNVLGLTGSDDDSDRNNKYRSSSSFREARQLAIYSTASIRTDKYF